MSPQNTGSKETELFTAASLGLIPDRHGAIREGRAALGESIAINSSALMTQSDLNRLEALILKYTAGDFFSLDTDPDEDP